MWHFNCIYEVGVCKAHCSRTAVSSAWHACSMQGFFFSNRQGYSSQEQIQWWERMGVHCECLVFAFTLPLVFVLQSLEIVGVWTQQVLVVVQHISVCYIFCCFIKLEVIFTDLVVLNPINLFLIIIIIFLNFTLHLKPFF